MENTNGLDWMSRFFEDSKDSKAEKNEPKKINSDWMSRFFEDSEDSKGNSADSENSEIRKCPHCGSTKYAIRQHISGYGEFIGDTTGEEMNNTELYSRLQYKNVGEYAYCADCGKRFAKISDLM